MPFFSLLFRGILLLLLEHRMGRGLAEASLGVAQVSLWCRFWRRSVASMTCRYS